MRGSIPCPGPETVVYGGNTICLEIRVGEEDRLLIIDAGSGIRALGNHLMANDLPRGPIHTQLFLTHTHWDHIIGFPFFTPIFIPGTKLEIYGPVSYEDESLEEIIGGQLRYRYFPVRQSELAAEISYHPLKEAVRDLGDGLMLANGLSTLDPLPGVPDGLLEGSPAHSQHGRPVATPSPGDPAVAESLGPAFLAEPVGGRDFGVLENQGRITQ